MPDEEKHEQANQPALLPMLVIQYDPKTGGFGWTMTGSIPMMALVGTIEQVKMQLLADNARRMMESQQQASKIVAAPGGKIPGLRL